MFPMSRQGLRQFSLDGKLGENADSMASFGERTIRNGQRKQKKEDDTVSLAFASARRRSEVWCGE